MKIRNMNIQLVNGEVFITGEDTSKGAVIHTFVTKGDTAGVILLYLLLEELRNNRLKKNK